MTSLSLCANDKISSLQDLLGKVSIALQAGDSAALQASSEHFKRASAEFSAWLLAQPQDLRQSSALVAAMERIRQTLAHQRLGTARQSGQVERALNALVPATRHSTYSVAVGVGSSGGLYGAPIRQTGSLGRLTA